MGQRQHYTMHRYNQRTNRSSRSNRNSDDRSQIEEPLFSSSFPAPPRRQAGSLHDVSFDEENGATFRHADSTNRALAALAQSKYERMERRRATSLLLMLALMAISFHGISTGSFKSAAGTLIELRPNLPAANKGRGIYSNSKKKKGGNAAEAVNATAELTEEELREEKVLSQFPGLLDINAQRSPEERPLFWHVPRSGGTSIKNAMGQCLGLVSASEGGAQSAPRKF